MLKCFSIPVSQRRCCKAFCWVLFFFNSGIALLRQSALLSSPQGMLQLFRGFLYSSVPPEGRSALKFTEVTGSVGILHMIRKAVKRANTSRTVIERYLKPNFTVINIFFGGARFLCEEYLKM